MSQESSPFNTFKPETKEAVEGLLWLGYLEDHFEFCQHNFTIRTLYGDEELIAAKLCQEYTETLGQAKAWAWAHVALCLVSVDGKTDWCPPIGPDREGWARARFQYVTSKWFYPTGEYIFNRYAILVNKQRQAIEGIQDLSNGSRRPSMPSQDSFTKQGTSPDTTPSEDPS
jgi:hypothetical protein